MRKLTAATLALSIVFVIVMSSSFAKAELNIGLTVANPTINPNEQQQITVTANEKGKGIVFVIQPAPGPAWQTFLNANPTLKNLWNLAPPSIKAQISTAIGDKIVSYAIVEFDNGGGSEILTFTEDFEDINGQPSTTLIGTYKVFFAYLSYEPWWCIELDWTCGVWNVVPEVPLGTAAAAGSMIAAVAFIKYRKRLDIPKI